jgi:pilus assembly protein CpaC
MIQVHADSGRIIISGTVKGQPASDDLMKMAGIYSKDIVNSLVIPAPAHARQILLEVKFAEVDRTKLEEYGFNLLSTGASNTIGTVGTQQFGAISGAGNGPISITTASGPGLAATAFSSAFGISNPLNIFLFRPDLNLGATIQDLEQKTILQILAEPNLMSVEGKKASFLAGGEFPFPVVQGGQSLGVVTIQFRPFGVKLDFTGFISEDNVIRLQIAPEVSTLDYSNAVEISGFTIPAISTRRAETEVELRDGQSFGIAGLLDQRVTALMSKVPGIGDIPILGQLFKSRSLQRQHTELLVLVTPHVVDPVGAATVAKPLPRVPIPYMKTPKFDEKLPGSKQLENNSQPATPREKP